MSLALDQLRAGVVDWPVDEVRRYRANGTWGERTIPQEFSLTAARRPEVDAVITMTETLSYRDLDERSDRLAASLINLGLERGERVLLQVDNRAETILLWYGLLKAGLIPVATLTLHRRHEINAIAEQSQAAAHAVIADDPKFDLVAFALDIAKGQPSLRTILTIGEGPDAADGVHPIHRLIDSVTLDEARPAVAERVAQSGPDDVAVFQLSGGTTGTPKIIPRLHAEYWSNSVGYARRLGWHEDIRVAHPIPIIHNAGIVCGLHAAHSVGGTLVLGVPTDAIELYSKAAATDALFMPAGVPGLRQSPQWPQVTANLQRAILSGSKVPEDVFTEFESRAIHVAQLFGMGEGPFLVTRPTDPAELRNEVVGAPLFDEDEVFILAPGTEEPVVEGDVGELCFKGSSTIRGYYAAPEHNERAFTSFGALRSGDLGRWRSVNGARGISLEGRIKDLINRGGEKINAEEVELLLMQHPRVVAAALVPMPDRKLAERACAYLVTTGGPLTMQEVQSHMDALGVAKYKWPERLEHVDALPTTAVGKISKALMRNDVAAKLQREPESGGI